MLHTPLARAPTAGVDTSLKGHGKKRSVQNLSKSEYINFSKKISLQNQKDWFEELSHYTHSTRTYSTVLGEGAGLDGLLAQLGEEAVLLSYQKGAWECVRGKPEPPALLKDTALERFSA